MAFQDNSGDIILDVVLTDEGRRRLARGDGSFKIVKFALGDEEINYELYDKDTTTDLADLEILQTPVLEAFTNNSSTMKTKLLSIPRNDILFMPILKLNEVTSGETKMHASGSFMVAVDRNSEDNSDAELRTSIAISDSGNPVDGFIFGHSLEQGSRIRVDAGIDNNGAFSTARDSSLIETQYMIEIDHRLGGITDSTGKIHLSPTSIDDDNVATYVIGQRNTNFVKTPFQTNNTSPNSPITGPITSFIEFKIRSSDELRTSYYLFNKIGGETVMRNMKALESSTKFIDSTVRVSGMTTGYSIDIPVRFVKIA